MNRIFCDMDGPAVDFEARMKELGLTGPELKVMRGAYLHMSPTPGAIAAIRSLIGMGFELWFATKPPTGISWAYGDKAQWVLDHVPELKRRIIITHDKGLLGDEHDHLIDDRIHKANCHLFRGTIHEYREGYGWPEILDFFRALKAKQKVTKAEWKAGMGDIIRSLDGEQKFKPTPAPSPA